MGDSDCLRTGEQSQHITNHQGQLSLPSHWGKEIESCWGYGEVRSVHLCH